MSQQKQKIAFQGELGANSHMACQAVRPDLEPFPCQSFEDMMEAVTSGQALCAMVPVENSVAGRVADIHHLLPQSGLYIIGEHYQRINAMLLGVPGAKIGDVKEIHSHVHALAQSRKLMAELGARPVQHPDTAGAARAIAERGDKKIAAIGPRLAAELYGLDILREGVEDAEHNTTRFLLMAREGVMPPANNGPCVTTIVFRVRSVPAALYKALGGFATNGINLTKLESYLVDGKFTAAQFYVDAEGHPEETPLKLALEELRFFCPKGEVRIMGTYPAHPFRVERIQNGDGV